MTFYRPNTSTRSNFKQSMPLIGLHNNCGHKLASLVLHNKVSGTNKRSIYCLRYISCMAGEPLMWFLCRVVYTCYI